MLWKFNTISDLVAESKKTRLEQWSEGSVGGLMRSDAYRMSEFGWPEGARLAAKKVQAVADRALKVIEYIPDPMLIADVMGGAYDMGALMSGVPEAWMRPNDSKTKQEIRLVVNVSSSSAVPEKNIQERGIAVAALAMALQSANYAVTIDAYSGTRGMHLGKDGLPTDEVYCRIADAGSGSQLDLDRIVFALAHTAFSRYIVMDIKPAGYPANPEFSDEDGVSLYMKAMKSWEPEWENPEAWVAEQFELMTGRK